jgi:hypothetical protein
MRCNRVVAMSPTPAFDDAARAPSTASDTRQRLMYRWFVEFNPLYLLSAALVLTGCFLLSRGIAHRPGEWLAVGITGVSEVYSLALLGGVALLTRIDQRRPAVVLAMLFFLYQWDLTLHTETCAYLGPGGAWASAAWLAIFVGKIYALGWALRLRFARALVAAWVLAGTGLAIGPHSVGAVGTDRAGALIAMWWFALGALYRADGIESDVELSAWGRTVLRRTNRAASIVSMALVGAHVLFWANSHAIALAFTLPVMPLLCVREVRSEGRAWAFIGATLLFVGVAVPRGLSVAAALAAAALFLRVVRPEFTAEPAAATANDAAPEPPYRWNGGEREASAPAVAATPGPAIIGVAERGRSYAGVFFALWLSVWTMRYSGGLWPAHVALLDAGLTIALVVTAWKFRLKLPLGLLGACYLDLVLREHLIPSPRSAAEWGATTIALGFALLGCSLAASYRLRVVTARPERAVSPACAARGPG